MMLNESNLHNYQRYTVDKIISTPKCGVFLEMGLGKTASTLTAITYLKKQGQANRVLIVAPFRVAEHTWTDELLKWSHLQHLTASKILGTKKQREKALEAKADIHIINIDNLPWLISYLGISWHFDMVVIDEFSCFKNYSTKRFKTFKNLIKEHPQMRLVGLTGTPSPNSLQDLWSQVYLLDEGRRLGKYITHFRQKYFYPLWGNGHIVYKWGLRDGAEEEIYHKISDICVSMKSEDYLTLPEVRYVDIPVSLTKRELDEYKSFQREQVLTYSDGEVITAGNAAVLSGKLRQWLGGAIYKDDSREYFITNAAKLERLTEMLSEINTPVIICYEYQHELERLKKAISKARTINEPGIIEKWNRGEVPVLLGHPQSMGHGLNLQFGGHTIIWYTLTWSLEYYQQMNARVARQGQKHKVSIYHLVCNRTIDDNVVRALRDKTKVQDALMEAIKADLPPSLTQVAF